MSYSSGEAAEQVVRMTLNGVEVAAKISGKAAERLAVLLYAVLKDQKKTRGKTRLNSMLRSGKELKVFAIGDRDLEKFCREAKKYGILYCVLKDKTANDGHTDVFVRAEDASKINRIFDRFGIATADIGSARTEIVKANSMEPSPGMIIFFDWDNKGSSGPQDGQSDHVGIVQKVENGIVYTIEGNSGDSCRINQYPVGYYEILGYGVPNY